ncbi:MAG TPA: hypothetical protein VGC30_08030 [Dokdonella sp.]
MLDDASLTRLAEIGIDVYLPRGAPAAAIPAQPRAAAPDASAPTAARAAAVLIVAETSAARGPLDGVLRALRYAQVDGELAPAPDDTALAAARGLVIFGEARARRIGAGLPAPRQQQIAWVVAAEVAALAGDARAKRALWSELKRLVRAARDGGSRSA